MPGAMSKKVSEKRTSREAANLFSACQAMSIAITTVLPVPVAILSAMGQRPAIIHKEPRAYYRPSTDIVNLPPPELFEKAEEYYSTAFHELTHATGHESRLNRRPSSEIRHFGDREYSQEELVAEMGAAFLCAKARIEQVTIENNAAYIQGWLSALKGTPKLVVHDNVVATYNLRLTMDSTFSEPQRVKAHWSVK